MWGGPQNIKQIVVFLGKDHEILVVIYFINKSRSLYFLMVGLTFRVCIKKEYAANG